MAIQLDIAEVLGRSAEIKQKGVPIQGGQYTISGSHNPASLSDQRDAADGLAGGPGSGADTFSPLLIGVFSTIAALLAGVGLYGVLATSVRQRDAELEYGWLRAVRRRVSFV